MNYLNTDQPYMLYQKARNGEIYVDKSLLIEKVTSAISTNNCYICLTRPRRFGKSMNAHMLGAYYTKGLDSSRLFDDLNIAKTSGYHEHRNCHNVVFMDLSRMPDICRDYQDYFAFLLQGIREDLQEAYPELNNKNYLSVSQMF